jgi:hypothetical protein
MSDFTFFSEAFWVGLTAGGFAFLGLIVRYAYKSKCKEFEVCCIKIKRDIDAEKEEDIVAMESGIRDKDASLEPSTPTLAPSAPTPLPKLKR